MPSPEVRPLLMLAASDLNQNEIKHLAQQISKNGTGWLVRAVANLREGDWQAKGLQSPTASRRGFDQERLEEFKSTIEKVERLLIGEAGFSKAQASRRLLASIERDPSSGGEQLPSPSKIAFDIWLARLCDVVPQSLVLHHASRIRNMAVHGEDTRSGWPLSDD